MLPGISSAASVDMLLALPPTCAGMRLLYTGDYSRIPDRHMPAADLPDQRPHIVIVEST